MPEFQTRDGLTLRYTDEGNGPVILCLPGLTRNQDDFLEFRQAHQLKARVIALTFRGRWPSDYDENWKNYAVPVEAADTIALLDHLEIPKALIIGTSRGGIVAMALSTMHKSRIAGVVLNDIGPKIEDQGLRRISNYVGKRPAWHNLTEGAETLSELYQDDFPDFDAHIWEKLTDRWFDHSGARPALRYDPSLKKSIEATPLGVDLWPFFRSFSGLPLGLIWGMRSDLLSEKTVSEMKALFQDMEIASLPNRGHVPLLNEPSSLQLIEKIFHQSFSEG